MVEINLCFTAPIIGSVIIDTKWAFLECQGPRQAMSDDDNRVSFVLSTAVFAIL